MTALHIDTENALTLTTADLLQKSIAVLGITGSGKSNTAAVIAEELLSAGVPLVIVDTSGEYWGLKERYSMIVAGLEAHADVDVVVTPEQGAALAEFSLRNGISVILNLRSTLKKRGQRFALVQHFIERLWDVSLEVRRPYRVLLEEAHNYVPQSESTPVKDVLTMMTTEGRKEGLGLVMVSQRPARIDKNVLSQAGVKFLHQVMEANDLAAYASNVPKLVMSGAEIERAAFGLKQGEALVVYGSSVQQATIRRRHTFHAGFTPGMEGVAVPQMQTVDTAMLTGLREALVIKDAPVEAPDTRDEQIATLRQELADARAEIERLLSENEEIAKKMNVQQIVAGQLVTSTPFTAVPAAVPNGSVQPQKGATPVASRLPENYRTANQEGRAKARQRRNAETAIRKARANLVPKWRQDVLELMYEFRKRGDTRFITREHFIVSLSLASSTWRPPTNLIELGIVEESTTDYAYRLVAKERFARDYPDLNANELVEELVYG